VVEALIPFYPCRNLTETRAFYESAVGLRLERDQGSCVIYHVGGGYLGFCEHLSFVADSGVIITLVTDDVDGYYRHFSTLGIPIEAAPKHNPRYGIYHFFARDPSGYRLEVQRFDNPLGRQHPPR
jgi:predicted enzyme related to lactoylglutathione lyase